MRAENTCSQAPDVECPLCHKEFPLVDGWELHPGAQIECPECGKEIEMADDDYTRHWWWTSVEPTGESK